MPTDIDTHIRTYFDWVEETSGCDLRPPSTQPPTVVLAMSDVHSTAAATIPSHRPRRSRMLAAAAAVVIAVTGLAAINSRTSTSPDQSADVGPAPGPDTSAPLAPNTAAAIRCSTPATDTVPWDGCVAMKVYINANTSADDVNVVRQALLDAPSLVDASQLRYLDPQAALEDARRVLIDEPETLELLSVDNIPTVFEVVAVPGVTDVELRALAAELLQFPGVRQTIVRSDAALQVIAPPSVEPPVESGVPVSTVSANPSAAPSLVAIGDSVMLGAAEELIERGFVVDATTSRTFGGVADLVAELRRVDRLPDTVVIGVGTNGPTSLTDLERTMSELASVRRVIVLTVRSNVTTGSSNDFIRSLPERYANVEVLDWEAAAESCRAECFYQDGIHLQQDGQNYYAELVAAAVRDGIGDRLVD